MDEELKKLTKQCLSIVDTATLKDGEIELWINSGLKDLVRLGIDAENKMTDPLIQGAVIMFVKSNFGMVDIKEKELAQETYSLLCNKLSLSKEYKIKEVDSNA